MRTSVPPVAVIGSANMDLVTQVKRFPLPGETVIGLNFHTFSGGKGANQATAIAKIGGTPSFVGKVGNDSFGLQIISQLRRSGVDTSHVFAEQDVATGTAVILVDDQGENSIVVSSGANEMVDGSFVADRLGRLSADTLLIQLETPFDAVRECKRFSKRIILNPAPALSLPEGLLNGIHWITPNETETEILTGIRPDNPATCDAAANWFFDQGVENVVITLGAAGSFLASKATRKQIPSIEVHSVDTTAAGDAFSGVLAYLLNLDVDPVRAVEIANRAGALTTTRLGAQPSLPTREELESVSGELI